MVVIVTLGVSIFDRKGSPQALVVPSNFSTKFQNNLRLTFGDEYVLLCCSIAGLDAMMMLLLAAVAIGHHLEFEVGRFRFHL